MNFDIVYADELDKVKMNKNAILVDIRTSEEYERSHWNNAVSMPMVSLIHMRMLLKRAGILSFIVHMAAAV